MAASLQIPTSPKKRGILIELSYQHDKETDELIDNVLIKTLMEQESQLGPTVVIGPKKHELLDDFPNDNNRAVVLFFEIMVDMWNTKEEILTHLENGTNVLIKSYSLDMLSHCYANNCFGIRTMREPLAAQHFFNKLQGLPLPDVIFYFAEPPSKLQEIHFNTLKEKDLNPTPEEKAEMAINDVIYSKVMRREEAKGDFGGYFEGIRSVTRDSTSMRINSIGCALARKAMCSHDVIKFY